MNQAAILDASWIMTAFAASGLARSLCTIQAPASSASGEPLLDTNGTPSGTYTAVTGLSDIACMDAPESEGGVSASEFKSPGLTSSKEKRHVLLTGYYPQLAQQTNWGDIGWRALITTDSDGTPYTNTYDIAGAESDSQSTMTRLALERETL